jgi:hypothetical protein
MHPYRVKEYLWLIVIIGFLLIALAGCSSSPKKLAASEQYCDLTTKTVSVKANGEVVDEKSVEVMECNDNRVKRLFQVQSGMAPNCGEFVYYMRQGNYDVQRKGVSCQKPNGSWEIVNTVGR